MSPEQLQTKIEAYLRNELPPEEHQQFVQDIKQNPEWKEQLLLHALSHEAIDTLVEDEARQKLDKIRAKTKKKITEPVPAPVIPLWQRPVVKWGIAAVVIGLVVLAALILPGILDEGPSTFVENVKKLERDQVFSNQLGGGTTPSWQTCLDDYDAARYRAAIDCFSQQDQDDLLAAQYIAHSYFKLEEFGEAGDRFERLLQNVDLRANTDVFSRVEWNWLLTLALREQHDRLAPLLDSVLSVPAYRYKVEAQQLKALVAEQ